MATIGFYACRTITTQRRNPTMATDFRMALEELLDKRGASADFLRDSLERLVQLLMEIEVNSRIGADRHERTPERVTHRNGYRDVNVNPKGDHRANQNGTHPEHHARHWSPAPSGAGRDNSDISQPTAHATAASRGIGTTPR